MIVSEVMHRIMGGPEVPPKFLGGEPATTLADIQEIQRRLTAARLRHWRQRRPRRQRHHAGGR
jgi:hypothetical protein